MRQSEAKFVGARGWSLGVALLFVLATPALSGGVAIVNTELSDNGDDDGFADTRETVTLRLNVRNTSGVALSNVTATLTAVDSAIACVTSSTINIGSLAVDETRLTATGFVFTIADVDRATLGLGPYDVLSTSFNVEIDSTPDVPAFASKLTLDLDLDIVEGSGPTSYFETFENTGNPPSLGSTTFEVQNLDLGLSTLAASDGYRCQYNDPDYVNSNTYAPFFPESAARCHLGADLTHAAEVFWGLSGPEPTLSPLGGRAFTGFHSMFFGEDLGPPENWTTPVGTVEAGAMKDPVFIARDAASPTLTFKHQASFADSRAFGLPALKTYDRGLVMVQVADDQGNPSGPWLKVDPYQNPYDQQNSPGIINCSYDPVDDGSTEDDYHAPADPERRFGPSSSCYPEWIYANMGETTDPFNPANVGLADGPGLAGQWGLGTWVESRVDLSRFRGRPIRVRFLASMINAVDARTWEEIFQFNPNSGDDGWWVDDVEISEVLTNQATVTVDSKDNSGLPDVPGDTDVDGVADVCDNCISVANGDQSDVDFDAVGDACDNCPFTVGNDDPDLDSICGEADNCPLVSNPSQTDGDNDGFGGACDCNDGSAAIFPGADEINDGIDNNCAGGADEVTGQIGFFSGDKTTISWPEQPLATRYQIARSNDPQFTTGCQGFVTLSPTQVDPAFPVAPNELFTYLVRAQAPNRGSWGAGSNGIPRTGPCIP